MKSVISKLCSVLLTTSLIVSVAWTAPNQKEVLAAAKATIPDETWVEVDAGTYAGKEIIPVNPNDTSTKYLKLTGDVVVSDALIISGTVHLDLAGYTLSSGEDPHDATIFLPFEGTAVYIYDSSATDKAAGTGKVLGTDNTNCVGTSPENTANIYIEGGTYSGAGKSGIYSAGGILKISGATITGNGSETATNVNGGGICSINPGELSITDCTISENFCDGNGGGIFADSSIAVNISGCVVSENTSGKEKSATGSGGGIYIKTTSCTVNISDTQILNNSCECDGGGVYILPSASDRKNTYTISNTEISGNKSSGNGGGLYIYGEDNYRTQLNTTDLTITMNTAAKGSGLYLNPIAKLNAHEKIYIYENTSDNLLLPERNFFKIAFSDWTAQGTVGVTYGKDWNPDDAGFPLADTKSLDLNFVSDNSDCEAYQIKSGDDSYSWFFRPKSETVPISFSLSLSCSIALVLSVTLPQGSIASESEIAYKIGDLSSKTVKFSDETVIDKGQGVYEFTIPVPATMMTSNITYRGSYFTETEGYTPIQEGKVTILDIATQYISDGNADSVARALLLYGAAAEGRFSSNPSNPAELVDPISAEEKSYITSTYLNGCILDKIEPANISDNSIEYYGSTLFFLSDNTLRHYFYVRDDIENYTFYFGGDEVEVRQVGETKFYYIQKAGLGAADIATQFSVVVEKTVNEETVTVFDFSYSAKNYLAKILANADEHDQSMIDLAYAACLYFDAVASYTPPTDPTPDP